MRTSTCAAAGVAGVLLLTGCHHASNRHSDEAQGNWDQIRARIKFQMARQQYEALRPEEAARTALEALALDGRFLDAYVLLCRAQIELHDAAAVARTLEEAQRVGLDAAVLDYLRGVAAEMTGDTMAALACYGRARQKRPDDPDYLAAEAEMLVAQGAPDAALQLLREHARQDETDATLDALGARLAALVGDVEYADLCYRAAVRKTGHPMLTLDYALFLMQQERFVEARAQLEPLAVQEGLRELRGPAHRALGRCHLALNDSPSAYRLLEPYLRHESADAEAQLLFATAALAEGRSVIAMRACRSVLEAQPSNAEARLLEAAICQREGRRDAALEALEEIAASAPERPLADFMAARIRQQQGLLPARPAETDRGAAELTPLDQAMETTAGLAGSDH